MNSKQLKLRNELHRVSGVYFYRRVRGLMLPWLGLDLSTLALALSVGLMLRRFLYFFQECPD